MAKVNIKSEKITPFGGIYYASKAFYALSLDKVINGTLGVRSSTYNGCTFARGFRPCFRQDGKSRCDIFVQACLRLFPDVASIDGIIAYIENRDGNTPSSSIRLTRCQGLSCILTF